MLILQLAHLAHGRIMISLLFVTVNSALLGRALFLQLQAVFGWEFNTFC